MSCLSLETKAKIIMCTTTQERERGMKGEGKEGERERHSDEDWETIPKWTGLKVHQITASDSVY